MARLLMVGFETGDLSELSFVGIGTIESTTVNSEGGAYSEKFATSATPGTSSANLASSVARARGKAWFLVDSIANPSSTLGYRIFSFHDNTTTIIAQLYLEESTAGVFRFVVYDTTGAQIVLNNVTIAANTWYYIEFDVQNGAGTGSCTAYLNGVSAGSASSQNFSSASIFGVDWGDQYGGAQTRNFFYDDIEVDDAELCGRSFVIARQGEAGTPTYDTFTKVGGATIDAVWSNTPFTTGTNANSGSTTSARAQTMLAASFKSTQTGHGNGVIVDGAKINGIKIGAVAKTSTTGSGGAAGSIRRRFGGADTDTSKTLTVSDAYYETPIFVDSAANLESGEIGWNKSSSAGAATHTVEDVWVMISYINSVATIAASLGLILASTNWIHAARAKPPIDTNLRASANMQMALNQNHFRWRTDGGAVDAAPTWGGAEDANGYYPGASNFRLRVNISNPPSRGGPTDPVIYQLYYSKNSGAYVPVTTTSSNVKAADASTDPDDTPILVPRLSW